MLNAVEGVEPGEIRRSLPSPRRFEDGRAETPTVTPVIVPRAVVRARQRVEQGRFPDVGIARQEEFS